MFSKETDTRIYMVVKKKQENHNSQGWLGDWGEGVK